MRPDEQFVGSCLVTFFGGRDRVLVLDGKDPPDLYLEFGDSRIGVEVTRLTQFTIESDGYLGNRTTQDFFGINLLNKLNADIGPTLPDGISLLVGLEMPIQNPSKYRKTLRTWVARVATAPVLNDKEERDIQGSKTWISVIPARPSGKKIVGIVSNRNSSADIGLNARLILEDRIRTKSDICAPLKKPIWLALFNDYWLADNDTYASAAREIKGDHCFERIFLVSEDAVVSELKVGQ